MAKMTWRARLCIGVSGIATALLVACGGGGDSGSGTTPADPARTPIGAAQALDDAFAVKLASIFIELTPSTASFYPFAIGADFLSGWSEAVGISQQGCATVTREKLGNLATDIDSVKTNRVNCTYAHGTPGTLTTSQTMTQTLELWTDLTIPEKSAWQYRDRYVSKASSSFTFKLLNGSDMDGQSTGDSTWSNFTDHRADGSQADTTDYQIRGTETSSFGNTDFALNTSITCTFAAGALSQEGTCLNGQARLTGTVYGRTVDASLSLISSSPKTYAIDFDNNRITVFVDKVGPDIFDSRYRVKTPAGREVTLTGEDTNWLGVF